VTEEEWLTATGPRPLMAWLQKSKRHKPGKRRAVLFACACAGALAHQMSDPTSQGLELAERFADKKWVDRTARSCLRKLEAARRNDPHSYTAEWAIRVFDPFMRLATPGTAALSVAEYVAKVLGPEESPRQIVLFRDIFGNPFRPVTPDPSWLTPTVVALADAIYADRAFDRLPILADALEEAGCDHPDVLAHCRGDGPHARGCWVVDLVLGKG
jgi:hypothetical protein